MQNKEQSQLRVTSVDLWGWWPSGKTCDMCI